MWEIWLFALLSIILIVAGGWSTAIADKYERSARVYGLARILSSIGASILFSCIAYIYCKRICPDDIKDRKAGITPTPLLLFLMLEWVVAIVVSSWLLHEMNRQPEIEGFTLKQILGASIGISIFGVVACVGFMLWYSGAEKRELAEIEKVREKTAKERDRLALEAKKALAEEARQQGVIATEKQRAAAEATLKKATQSRKALEEQELLAYRLSKMSESERKAYLDKNKPTEAPVLGGQYNAFGGTQYGGTQYGGTQYGGGTNKESQELLRARQELEARNQALAQTEKETKLLKEQEEQLSRRIRQQEKSIEEKVQEEQSKEQAKKAQEASEIRRPYQAGRYTDVGEAPVGQKPRVVAVPQDVPDGSRKDLNVRVSGTETAPVFKRKPEIRIQEQKEPTLVRRFDPKDDPKDDEPASVVPPPPVPPPVPPRPVKQRVPKSSPPPDRDKLGARGEVVRREEQKIADNERDLQYVPQRLISESRIVPYPIPRRERSGDARRSEYLAPKITRGISDGNRPVPDRVNRHRDVDYFDSSSSGDEREAPRVTRTSEMGEGG